MKSPKAKQCAVFCAVQTADQIRQCGGAVEDPAVMAYIGIKESP